MTDKKIPSDEDETPLVPRGVIEGIYDILEGNTASKEDIAEVLKFGKGKSGTIETPDEDPREE